MNVSISEYIDKSAHENHKQILNDFLLYLAKNANPARFFPFPNFIYNTEDSKDDMVSIPTEHIKTLTKRLSNLPNDQELVQFIFNTNIDLTYHGKQLHNDINEFEFKYSLLEDRLADIFHKKRWYMFHGSALSNWHSIVRGGIKCLSGTKFMTTGAVWGNGIYMSDSILTAQSYGSCVAVVELYEDPEPYKKTTNIYVYDKKMIRPRYLFDIKKHINQNFTEILQYYKKINEKELEDVRNQKRITADLKEFTILNVDHPTYSILYKEIIIKLVLDKYPYKFPVLFLVYKVVNDKNNIINSEGIVQYDFASWTSFSNLKDIFSTLDGYEMTDIPYKNEYFTN
jgi:hypothetical protein